MRAATRLLLVLLACAQLALTAGPAPAQTRTIKIIVPSTAGGGADTLARLLGDQISREAGSDRRRREPPRRQQHDRHRGRGARGARRQHRAGRTTPEFVINAHLKKLNYDPLTSFEPICYLVKSPQIIVVNAASPYRTLADLMNDARQKPGELTIASAGPASSPHIAIEALKHAAGVNINFIPYQGSTPAVNALLGEHVTAVMASYPNVAELITTGKLRALATASAARIEPMPNVPTVAEVRLQGLRSRHLVRPRRASEDAGRSDLATRRVVHRRAQGSGGHAEACRARAFSRRHLRR